MSRGTRRVLACALTLALPGCFSPAGSASSITDSDAGTTAAPGTTTATSTTSGTSDATQGSGTVVTAGTAGTSDATTSAGPVTDSSAATTGAAQCGDGVVEGGEACDDGVGNGDAQPCRGDCSLAVCGDGQPCGACEPAELCDDGNEIGDDACDAACQPTACGDGVAVGTEECDDGNQISGDGCSPRCLEERQYVFVSSVKVPADFAELAAVDLLCAGLAATKLNPRREFVAWMSVAGTDAATRIGVSVFPYVTPTGVEVAASTQDLLDGLLLAPILEDEDGVAPLVSPLCDGVSAVWTGTTPSGGVAAETCTDWGTTRGEGMTGNFALFGPEWTHACDRPCASPSRVYCIEKVR